MSENKNETQVVWVDIPCQDLDRAITFYSAVLACEPIRQSFDDMSMGILPSSGVGVGACLFVHVDEKPSLTGPLVYLNCPDRLDDAVKQVEPHGGEILIPKHAIGPHGFRAVVKDSEGNRVALHSM